MNTSPPLASVIRQLNRITIWIIVFWTLAVAVSVIWNAYLMRDAMVEAATHDARNSFNKDVLYRRWATSHGGVYVPVTDRTPPNPYLTDVLERDIVTPSGRRLTLMNPAYMTRQVHELGVQYGSRGHITSLKPLRPENLPDAWEEAALKAFEQGQTEVISQEMLENQTELRFMKPLIAEKGCLKCHAVQGYKEGEIRGGVSVSVALAPYFEVAHARIWPIAGVHAGLWVLGVFGILLGAQQIRMRIDKQLKLEQILKGNEERLMILFEFAPDAYYLSDVKGNFVDGNKAAEELLGYHRNELIGKNFLQLKLLSSKQLQKAAALLAKNVMLKSTGPDEFNLNRKNGSQVTVEIRTQPVHIHNKTLVLGIVRDITERKRAEEEIRHNETRLRGLVRILQYSAKTTQEFLDYALNEVIQLTESRLGYIYFYNEDRKQFVLNTWSKDVMDECMIVNPSTVYDLEKTGIWGEAVRQRKPIILNDFKADHPLKKGYPEGHAHLSRFMTVPVFKNDQVVAVVGVANKLSEYNDTDVLQLTLLMNAVWNSVDIKRAEDEIKSLSKFPSENPFPILRLGQDGTVLYANKASSTLLKEWKCSIGEHVPDFWCDAVTEILKSQTTKIVDIELDERTFSFVITPVSDLNYVNLYGRDITERKQAEEKLKSLLREKEILIREVHHRVKNNFLVVSSLLGLQSRDINDTEVKAMFMQSRDRINSMALLHKRLYQSQDLSHINFSEYIRTLAADLFKAYKSDSDRIFIVIDVDDIVLDANKVLPCGLIVNELISNALKYGFPKSRTDKGQITVSFHQINGNEVELVVMDNGVGLPDDFDIGKSKSLGLQLVNMMAEDQLGGELKVSGKGGAKFQIQFALHPPDVLSGFTS